MLIVRTKIETTIRIGYAWSLPFGWYNPLPSGDPDLDNPINKAGWSARMNIRPMDADPDADPLIQLELDSGITFDNAHVIPRLTSTQTLLFEPGVYDAAIRMVPASGEDDAVLLVELKMLAVEVP